MMFIGDCELKVIQGDIKDLKADLVVKADLSADEISIRNACANALKEADRMKAGSVAFPVLGCVVGGFPLKASAKIMAQEVWKHLREEKSKLKEIVFCARDKEAYEIFKTNVNGYLEYMFKKQQAGPFVAVDAIIEIDGGIVIIERSNPPFGWALPGGFVDNYESLEDAVRREMKEETALELLDLKQFHAYSKPGRDPRFHTIGIVFTAKGEGTPKAGDDAAGLKVIKLDEIDKINFAFDHRQILKDYLAYRKSSKLPI